MRDGPENGGDGGSSVVRPVGFVADEPVIRRVGDRDLYLGNWRAADPSSHDREFDAVVSATTDRYPLTTHHHPLVDGPGNDWADFAAAVDDARRLSRGDGSVLVHCKAGVSRSSTILATTLGAEEGRGFREGLDAVQRARPLATPHPKLLELGVTYLAARS